MKTVDKYQFNEEMPKYDNGIQTFLAYHTVLKKYFTLKRLNFTGQTQEVLYKYLIKEVSVLKKITSQNVYKCYKMLKTKNNLYLIYDNIEGQTLAKIIKTDQLFQTKLNIVKQINAVLSHLSKLGISHLALTPENILVLQNNKIKVVNFGQAQELTDLQKTAFLIQSYKGQITQYISPEVLEKKVHINSDIFSFGMIIIALFKREFQAANKKKLMSQSEKIVKKLQMLSQKMTIKVPQLRINIQEFEKLLNESKNDDIVWIDNKSTKSEKIINERTPKSISPGINKPANQLQANFSPSKKNSSSNWAGQSQGYKVSSSKLAEQSQGNKIMHTTSVGFQSQRDYQMLSKTSRNLESPQKQKLFSQQKETIVQIYIRKIMKQRNISIALLNMASACLKNIESKSPTSIRLAFLLIKKATVIISQQAKLLKIGKNGDMAIEQKIRDYFFKSKSFLKIQPIINNQMLKTQQRFQKINEYIQSFSQYKNNPNLRQQIRSEKMNNNYLRKCAHQFLSELSLTHDESYSSIKTGHLVEIYLISLLSLYDTYEEAFGELFSQCGLTYKNEPLIKELLKTQQVNIVSFIELGLDINFDQDIQTLKTIKSSRNLIV